MSREPRAPLSPEYETPTRRVVLLGLLFAALVVIGVFTVLRPELEDADGQEQPPTDTEAVVSGTPVGSSAPATDVSATQ